MLPLTIRSRADEPAHAALVRLATRCGARNVQSFARSIGFSVRDLREGRNVEQFASIAGVDPKLLCWNSAAFDAADRRVQLCRSDLLLGDWSLRCRRWCTSCLRDDCEEAAALGVPAAWWATSRSWWDIRSVTGCALHGEALLDRCWRCGQSQPWQGCLFYCSCGADLLRTCGDPHSSPSSEYILGRLSYLKPQTIPLLDALPLSDAIRVLELLGAARIRHRLVKPRRSEAERREDRSYGHEIVCLWPDSFSALMDHWLEDRPPFHAAGLTAAYGWIYTDLADGKMPGGFAEQLSPVLREHAVRNGLMAQDEARLGSVPKTTISGKEAARIVGSSYETTRRKLEEAGSIPTGSRRGVRFVLDPMDVLRLKRPPRRPIQLMLGVGRKQSRAVRRHIAQAAGVSSLDEDHVRSWLNRLQRRASPALTGSLTPLPKACRNMSVSLTTACDGIAAGLIETQWCEVEGVGLNAVLVRQDDLRNLRPPSERICIEEAARTYGVHHEAARFLARTGAFGTPTDDGRLARRGVADFFARHVTAAELAHRRETSSRALQARFATVGILPRYGPPDCRQTIFARADLAIN